MIRLMKVPPPIAAIGLVTFLVALPVIALLVGVVVLALISALLGRPFAS